MGFEYKIVAKFTEKQTGEIVELLQEGKRCDDKQIPDQRVCMEFKISNSQEHIPNTTIIFESDGLYVCQYSSSYLWINLDLLKNYLSVNGIEYKILDYSD